ncbi:MAG TPA: PCYCGC motif-containing (lipo)protein [Anaerolineales bacterium]|nr:PCYCGC motif-containing (lipo)protein [Anaerolineales bacterium]
MLARRLVFPIIALFILVASLTAGCGGSRGDGEHMLQMAPLDQMPAEVQAAPVVVQQAYQFAAANPEVMTQLPCYCGCGDMGHTSNYSCYVAGVAADGKIKYDSHALGCSICVDITQDTMRLLKQGKSVPEIRTYVDETYAKYGPSNMP